MKASRRLFQASDVLAQHEDLSSIAPQGLEDAVAVQEAVIEDRDLCLLLRHEPVIQINPHRSGFSQGLQQRFSFVQRLLILACGVGVRDDAGAHLEVGAGIVADSEDRKSTRLNSSHLVISYAVFCLKKK